MVMDFVSGWSTSLGQRNEKSNYGLNVVRKVSTVGISCGSLHIYDWDEQFS